MQLAQFAVWSQKPHSMQSGRALHYYRFGMSTLVGLSVKRVRLQASLMFCNCALKGVIIWICLL